MLTDAGYVAWANEKAVHLLSYVVDPKVPDPTTPIERDGERVEVLVRFPQFTVDEADFLAREIVGKVRVPDSKPWAAVLSPDGKEVLAELARGSAKDFRSTYEEVQEDLGPSFPRDEWKAATAALARSSAAEADERWRDAVAAAREAQAGTKGAPKPLAARAAAQVEALRDIGLAQAREAKATADSRERSKALDRIASDFAELPEVVKATR